MAKWTRELRLLNACSLSEHLDFVRRETRGGRDADEGAVADAWRAAQARHQALARTEAGLADDPPVLPLSAAAQPWLEALTRRPHFQRTYAAVPVAFGLVELDRLLLVQHEICLEHVERRHLPANTQSDEASLLRLCLPHEPANPSMSLSHAEDALVVAHSRSMDLRFLGAELLRPDEVGGPAFPGSVAGVLALAVGFSANCLSVIRLGGRMLLNNGYHRAYALRQAGVTHVPAVIEVCAGDDDVEVAGGERALAVFQRHAGQPRPPLFKDFFDPGLTTTYRAAVVRKEVRIRFEVSSQTVHD